MFVGLMFVALPREAIELNRSEGWPRWESGVASVVGVVFLALGLAVCLLCTLRFLRARGTPVPAYPPKEFVESGLYRYSRNPMYVAYVAIFLGLFLYSGELALLGLTGLVALALHFWIVWIEEPPLLRRFGDPYAEYLKRVQRWLGSRGRR